MTNSNKDVHVAFVILIIYLSDFHLLLEIVIQAGTNHKNLKQYLVGLLNKINRGHLSTKKKNYNRAAEYGKADILF